MLSLKSSYSFSQIFYLRSQTFLDLCYNSEVGSPNPKTYSEIKITSVSHGQSFDLTSGFYFYQRLSRPHRESCVPESQVICMVHNQTRPFDYGMGRVRSSTLNIVVTWVNVQEYWVNETRRVRCFVSMIDRYEYHQRRIRRLKVSNILH